MMTMKATHSGTGCRLCLVRHGETAWNAQGRLQGHVDIPLNETGRAQADALRQRLASLDEGFAALYCSDLLRTRQTAAGIAEARQLQPIHDARLRERHYGIFQGLTHDEGARLDPVSHGRFRAREPAFALPGSGESLLGFAARVREALDEIATRHAGESVLVVTHGGVLDIAHRLTQATALELPRQFNIPNAALNWLEAEHGQWRLLSWGDEAHLEDALDEFADR
ncbi:MAG: histidine phosphatase family protein [Thauera sp.]|jgi:probable phosphoglycerate mutase|nr:histidine phosphatase family protein [Thauera sp.]